MPLNSNKINRVGRLKKCLMALSVVATLPVFGHEAKGAAAITATAMATVETLSGITAISDLAFGSIIAGTSAGSVTINPLNGNRSKTGNLSLVSSSFGAATFEVAGTSGNNFYTVTLPADNVVTISNGTQVMKVNSFTSARVNPHNHSSGKDTFFVGATLLLGASQMPGVYTGNFLVNVTFN